MLDEVLVAGTFGAGGLDESGDGVPLVVAREQQGFFAGLLAGVGVALVGDLQVHEPVEDLQPGVAGEDGLPQVGGSGAEWVGRVAGVVAVAAVEGQEHGVLAGEPGGHVHFGVGNREVHEGAGGKAQQRLALGQAILLVLLDRMIDGLSEVGLELGRGDGDAVDEEHQIDGLARAGPRVAHLPHDPQPHRLILGGGGGVEPGVGLELAHREVRVEVGEPAPQHGERPAVGFEVRRKRLG